MNIDEETVIYVFSLNGELLYNETVNQSSHTINCGNLAPGVYYVKAQSSSEVKIGRFIKK